MLLSTASLAQGISSSSRLNTPPMMQQQEAWMSAHMDSLLQSHQHLIHEKLHPWLRQQLGQGPLHRRRQAHRLRHGAQGDQELRVFPSMSHGVLDARPHGLALLRSRRQHLTPGNLCPWPVWHWKQLGRGPLQRGRQAHRIHPRQGAHGDRELGLLPRFRVEKVQYFLRPKLIYSHLSRFGCI